MIDDFFIDTFKVKGDYFFNKKTKLKFLNKLQNRFFHLFNKKTNCLGKYYICEQA